VTSQAEENFLRKKVITVNVERKKKITTADKKGGMNHKLMKRVTF